MSESFSMSLVKRFKTDESGAVTTDWVFLTAGLITLALVVVLSVTNATTSLGPQISNEIAQQTAG